MSIRGFHLLFIVLASVFCALVAVWAFVIGADELGLVVQVMGGICAAAAIGLPFYGVYFYRKTKKIII
jgi:hypothetical protein